MNWVRCVAVYLSHAKALVLVGTLRKTTFHSSLLYGRRMEGKGLTLICVGAIVANHFLNFFFHTVSTYGAWGNYSSKNLQFSCVLASALLLNDLNPPPPPPAPLYHPPHRWAAAFQKASWALRRVQISPDCQGLCGALDWVLSILARRLPGRSQTLATRDDFGRTSRTVLDGGRWCERSPTPVLLGYEGY